MNATQEEINNIVKINDGKNDYEFYRYEVVTETDAEPGEIKIILLKSSEGIIRQKIRILNEMNEKYNYNKKSFKVQFTYFDVWS